MLRSLFRDLAVDPLRTTLTGLSMMLGILAIITSVLVGSVGKDALLATNAQLHGRPPTYSAQVSGGMQAPQFVQQLTDRFQKMDPGRIALVSEVEHITYSVATKDDAASESMRQVRVLATTANYRGIYILPLVRGRWLAADDAFAALEVVGNKFMFPDAVPATVALKGSRSDNLARARVVGIVNDGIDQPTLYLNLHTAKRFAPQLPVGEVMTVQWNPSRNASPDQIKNAISDALADTMGGEAAEVMRTDSARDYEDVTRYLERAFLACAVLLLLVSVIGLINIGLASIEQRAHELLIRRAIGASRRSIGTLVLGSMLLLSLVVAAVAILLSLGLVILFPTLLPADTPISSPSFPAEAALVASLAAVMTALLGSIAPAIKAMRLEPALALR